MLNHKPCWQLNLYANLKSHPGFKISSLDVLCVCLFSQTHSDLSSVLSSAAKRHLGGEDTLWWWDFFITSILGSPSWVWGHCHLIRQQYWRAMPELFFLMLLPYGKRTLPCMKHFLWVVLNKVQLWFSILSVADSFLQKWWFRTSWFSTSIFKNNSPFL